jgi:hypothetical protein
MADITYMAWLIFFIVLLLLVHVLSDICLHWNVKEKVEVRGRGVTIGRTNKQVLEGIIAYFPLIRHGPHRKRKKLGKVETHRQQGELISLLLLLAYFPYFEKMKAGLYDLHAVCVSV